MPRRGPVAPRKLEPDSIYKSTLVTQLINKVLIKGKRSLAERIVYKAMKTIASKTGTDPDSILARAVDNVRPKLEVRSRRVGGAAYQVPVDVQPRRATTLAVRWIVSNARARNERTMADCLANEILDAANGVGVSIKKCQDLQKMAEANRAFAHYRW